MVTWNIATRANLSNGSHGCITKIVLDPRELKIDLKATTERKVFLLYPPELVIIYLDFCELSPLPDLLLHHVPLSPLECKFSTGMTPSPRIMQWQLAITPAYAFTDFKAQGQTINYVLVDIGRTMCFALSLFNAYVASLRSHGHNCIQLLRDFDNELFLQHPFEDLRIEEARIEQLVDETKKCYAE
jgi:hypothetical protein